MEKNNLGKVSVFPALSGMSGRDDNVDTIKLAADKIGADNVYTTFLLPTVQYLAAY